ncbi:Protein lin-54 [Bulinus truncatus]|nr:Protein lin-54 [Bulinus truncatus]
MTSQGDSHDAAELDAMEVASCTGIVVSNPLSEGMIASSSAVTPSTTDTVSYLTVQNHNGPLIIQQPIKNTNNGPNMGNNGAALAKSHIIVRQKPLGGTQQITVPVTSVLGDLVTLDKSGVKRSASSTGSNVITKVIITKNPVSGQPQPLPAKSSSQTLTLSTLSSGSSSLNSSSGSSDQPGTPTKTVTLTSQGILSPVKTVIATVPGTNAAKIVPYKIPIPISPSKTPTKITMIPVSRSPNKTTLNPANITVLSRALNTFAQSGNVTLKATSPSKVIIKQGPAPTGSGSITVKTQSLPTIAPQTTHPLRTAAPIIQNIQAANIVQNTAVTVQNKRPVAISTAGTVQQIQVPGSRFHYVRLVSPVTSSTTTSVVKTSEAVTHIPGMPKNAIPITMTTAPQINQVKITLPLQQNTPLAPKPVPQSVHRVILPATTTTTMSVQASTVTSLAPIQPAPTVSIQNVNQLPPGTTILSPNSANLQGLRSFALVPASYVTQLQLNKPLVTQASLPPPPPPPPPPVAVAAAPRQTRDYVPIASIDPAVTQYTVSRNAPAQNGPTLEATGARPRKPCNCTKSQCLKLYCDCFANGEFCQNCNCTNCANNLEHEEERSKAIKSCLDRNPQAFHPKIGKAKDVEGNRRHTKGCNCKRSGCLKNYCECYEAKIMCSSFCKCFGCKNFEESPERKTLMHLADAAEVRVQQQTAAKSKLSSQISSVPSRPPTAPASGERLPFALITSDVAEATSACLLAQAEEAERMKMPSVVQERMVIEEFGRCLMQIIDSANRTRSE